MNSTFLHVKHKCKIFLIDYPKHVLLKTEIIDELESYIDVQDKKTNVKATMTEWNIDSFEITNLKKYIITFLNSEYPFLSRKNKKFVFESFWGNIYRKNDFALDHDHLFSVFSVVYFLKTELNSAPLIFSSSGTKIKSKEGRIVIFPSYLRHKVSKHNLKETRITLSGNIDIE